MLWYASPHWFPYFPQIHLELLTLVCSSIHQYRLHLRWSKKTGFVSQMVPSASALSPPPPPSPPTQLVPCNSFLLSSCYPSPSLLLLPSCVTIAWNKSIHKTGTMLLPMTSLKNFSKTCTRPAIEVLSRSRILDWAHVQRPASKMNIIRFGVRDVLYWISNLFLWMLLLGSHS